MAAAGTMFASPRKSGRHARGMDAAESFGFRLRDGLVRSSERSDPPNGIIEPGGLLDSGSRVGKKLRAGGGRFRFLALDGKDHTGGRCARSVFASTTGPVGGGFLSRDRA